MINTLTHRMELFMIIGIIVCFVISIGFGIYGCIEEYDPIEGLKYFCISFGLITLFLFMPIYRSVKHYRDSEQQKYIVQHKCTSCDIGKYKFVSAYTKGDSHRIVVYVYQCDNCYSTVEVLQ